jgi:hypothetical protein
MFATLPSRSRAALTAFALLLPVVAVVSLGPAVLDSVDRLSAETLYCAGLSSLLVMMGAAALLALPRSEAEIGAAVSTLRRLAELPAHALPHGGVAVGRRPASA